MVNVFYGLYYVVYRRITWVNRV